MVHLVQHQSTVELSIQQSIRVNCQDQKVGECVTRCTTSEEEVGGHETRACDTGHISIGQRSMSWVNTSRSGIFIQVVGLHLVHECIWGRGAFSKTEHDPDSGPELCKDNDCACRVRCTISHMSRELRCGYSLYGLYTYA